MLRIDVSEPGEGQADDIKAHEAPLPSDSLDLNPKTSEKNLVIGLDAPVDPLPSSLSRSSSFDQERTVLINNKPSTSPAAAQSPSQSQGGDAPVEILEVSPAPLHSSQDIDSSEDLMRLGSTMLHLEDSKGGMEGSSAPYSRSTSQNPSTAAVTQVDTHVMSPLSLGPNPWLPRRPLPRGGRSRIDRATPGACPS